MKILKIKFLIFLISSILASCVDDVEYNGIIEPYSNYVPPATRSVSDLEEVIVKYGYTYSVNLNTVKLLFNKKLADATGLQQGSVYIIRNEKYQMVIPTKGGIFFDDQGEEKSQCGLVGIPNGTNSENISLNRGYNISTSTDSSVTLECYLIHILSDVSGKSIDQYYPCNPNVIEWKGVLWFP